MRLKDHPKRRERHPEETVSLKNDVAETDGDFSSAEKMNQIINNEGDDDDDGDDDALKNPHHQQGRGLHEDEDGGRKEEVEEEEEEQEKMEVSDGNGNEEENGADAVNRQGAEGTTLAECNNAPSVITTTAATTTTTTSPPSPPPHPPPPALATSALTGGLHPAFSMHGTNRSYLPSHMFSSAVAGMSSPAVAPPSTSSSSSASRASADKESASPLFEAFRDGSGGVVSSMASALGQYRSAQGDSSAATSSTAAASYYASRLQQEGFPYGLSGVPSMSSYGFHNELYNYVSNGFPRKSRVCSYCSKVFTRSTTRRYHEKRCPLLRAAGSLIQGTSGAKAPPAAAAPPPSSNGPMNDAADVGLEPSGSGSRPPPLVLGSESPSPPLPPKSAPSTSSVLSSSSLATSMGLASLARSHALTSSPFYHLYGSHALTTTMSTSAASALTSSGAASTPPPQSSVDQNRNSVLSAGKKMAEQEARGEGREPDTDTAESDLTREKAEAGERPPQQHPLFSPHSTASRTPSEEDRGSEEGGDSVPSKPLPGVTPTPDPSLMAIPPYVSFYQLAALRAARSLAASTDGAAFPLGPFAANVPSSAEDARPLTSSEAQELREDKEEASPREEDHTNAEDEDTDNYSYSNPNTDIQEPGEAGEGKKKCGVCEEEFAEHKQLVTHASVHQKFAPHRCHLCGEEFSSKAERVDHQRSHEVKYALECVVCGTMMQTKFALRQHVRRKHGATSAEDVPCRICRLSLAGVRNLYDHLLSHRRLLSQSAQLSLHYLAALLACPLPVGGLDSDEEEEEEEEASQDNPPASIDSKTSQDSPEEQRSEASVPSGPIPSSPAPASAVGDSPVRVNGGGSRETGSTREKELCRICQKEFPKSYMRYHEKEHADQKPYECSICKKRFGYKNNMKSHMKLHAGIKPYQCNICMAKFTRGSTLRRHLRRHGIDAYKSGASLQNRSREAAMLSQASAHPAAAAAALMGRKGTSGSPPVAGSRAMKADPALLVSMGKQEMAGKGKGYDTASYPASDAVHHNMLEMFRNFPQAAMLQHCLPQQYLGYGAGFPALPAAVRPQQNEQPVDFSMPGKKRQRNHSSSSSSTFTPTTSQGLAFQSALASHLSPAYSQSSAASQQAASSALLASSSSSSRSQRASGDRDGKAGGEKGAETPRSSASYPAHQYHPKQRASLYETVERLMENHSHKEASSSHQLFSQNLTKKEPLARSGVQDAASPPPSSLQEFSKRNGVPDTVEEFSPREVAMYGMRKRQEEFPSKSVAQDSSTQVALCCPQPSSSSRSSEQHRRDSGSPPARSSAGRDPLQQETLGSLIQDGRLFCCSHCDCYFSDYTMYHLHCKMHPADRPFLCFLCQLDCKDRTAFARHMLNHLQ